MQFTVNFTHTFNSAAELAVFAGHFSQLFSNFPGVTLQAAAPARPVEAAPPVASPLPAAVVEGAAVGSDVAAQAAATRRRRTKAEMEAARAADAARAQHVAAPAAVATAVAPAALPVDIFNPPAAAPPPAAAEAPAVTVETLRELTATLIDFDGGPVAVGRIMRQFGGAISKIDPARIPECAAALRAAIAAGGAA